MALTTLAFAVPASTHVVLAEPSAKAGSYYAGFFRVPHGCEGSDTVSIRISLPEAIVSARPQPKPGWTLTIARAPLAKPIDTEGGHQLTERVVSVTWEGRLPADEFDQFGLMMKLPDTPGPLYFPTEQRCAAGATQWINIPKPGQEWHSIANPAPVLMLEPDDMATHSGH